MIFTCLTKHVIDHNKYFVIVSEVRPRQYPKQNRRHCEEARRGNLQMRLQAQQIIVWLLPFTLRVASRGKTAVLPFGAAVVSLLRNDQIFENSLCY